MQDTFRKPKVLVLREGRNIRADTILDHYNALIQAERLDTYAFSMYGKLPSYLDLDYFDVIVVHYSITLANPKSIDETTRSRIASFRGLKVCFIQDEYRFVNATINSLNTLGFHILFSAVPSIYPVELLPNLKIVPVLTGYVSDKLKNLKCQLPYSKRPIDIFYRSRTLPYWLGYLAQEKVSIANAFLHSAKNYNLLTDISCQEEDRLYGKKWLRALMRSKACLGTESGATIFDYDGSVQSQVEKYLKLHPCADFDEVQKDILSEYEKDISICAVISPRVFEAAACKTLMILYEGYYSGILVPWKHYLPLKKDLSNMSEICACLRDKPRVEKIVETAYEEIIHNSLYSYKKLTNLFEVSILSKLASRRYETPLSNSNSSCKIWHIYIKSLNIIYTPLRFFSWVKSILYHFIFGVVLRNNPKKEEIKKWIKSRLCRTQQIVLLTVLLLSYILVSRPC